MPYLDHLSEPQLRIKLLDSAMAGSCSSRRFLTPKLVSIGRSPENKVVIQDPYVSRHHADLLLVEDRGY